MQVPFVRLRDRPRRARHSAVGRRSSRASRRRRPTSPTRCAPGPASGANSPFVQFPRLEQPRRARPRRLEFARIPLAGLDAPPGMLRAVIGLRGEAAHRLVAQARAQPLEPGAPSLRPRRRHRRTCRRCGPAAARNRPPRGAALRPAAAASGWPAARAAAAPGARHRGPAKPDRPAECFPDDRRA